MTALPTPKSARWTRPVVSSLSRGSSWRRRSLRRRSFRRERRAAHGSDGRRNALWRLFLGIDVAVLACGLLGWTAAYVPPGLFWWAQLAAIVLPYATLLAVFLAAVPLLGRRWAWVGAHALLVILVMARTGVPGRLAGEVQTEPGDLRLITFNVPNSIPDFARRDSMAAFTRNRRPDVLALQDAFVRGDGDREPGWLAAQVRGVTDSLRYHLPLPSLLPSKGGLRKGGVTSVPILTRAAPGLQVIDSRAIMVGPVEDGQSSAVLRVRMRWQERDFVLYNVHLRSFSDARPWWVNRSDLLFPSTWRRFFRAYRADFRERAADVEEIAAAIGDETLPVIVAGDLNSTPDNWSVRRLMGGRTDAVDARGGITWGRTYPANRPLVRIDAIYVDPAFKVVSVETHDVGFSDHRPVEVHLRWREDR